MVLRLLVFGPFERRDRGGWRFGARIVSDSVVDRIVANGQAYIDGTLLRMTTIGDKVTDRPSGKYRKPALTSGKAHVQ